MQKTKNKIRCGNCGSVNVVKRGFAKNKLQTLQKYQCKECNRIFTKEQTKGKTYPLKVILQAISTYNLGNTLEKTRERINKKYKLAISTKTINNWISQYKNICTFNKLRNKAIKLYQPNNIIFKQTLNHIQPYTFQYHKAKLEILFKDFSYNNQFTNISKFYEPLKSYLEKIPTNKFPHHIFTYHQSSPNADIAQSECIELKNNNAIAVWDKTQTDTHTKVGDSCPVSATDVAQLKNIDTKKHIEQRASQIKFPHLKIKHLSKTNLANKLASLAINLATTNKDRHKTIQDFFLINDSTTVAVEVPIYLTNWDAGYYKHQKGFIFPLKNYQTPITGHIDILQVRNSLIHILDYKPDAKNQNPTEQLTIYALALSRKLNLPLYYFKCAWFDENSYFEFFPLHIVYPKR